jgi:hypothetical protein
LPLFFPTHHSSKKSSVPVTWPNHISIDDYDWVNNFRTFLGIEACDKAFQDAKVHELNDLTWTLHIWLQANGFSRLFQDNGFSRLPCSSVGRKFAFLDAKVVKSLLDFKTNKRMLEMTEGHQGGELQKEENRIVIIIYYDMCFHQSNYGKLKVRG